ncbi:hypothetical protein CI088_11410 [Enterococcus plantarum]|uniref:LXG domain-containing protein n=2 Tax=Enterococcus plantarum TaxID=1077675 RepID=A0A2W3YVS6_9ENTE|nr:T7SS effector LXG polymorphic toxin [Enterococcus plantarum]PZL71998.1 hypothetical protein CI088_11410 [Enterococcus plantarum]
MGLKFYVGEMQAQASDASRMNQEANQAIASLQKSIAQFLFAPLSGKAYDSAKRYFNVVYTPICRSVTMTGEAMASAHKRLINEYQSSVSSIDTDEDQIMSQINRFEQLKQQLEHQMTVSKEVQPSLERRYINACESIAKKREQLEKFHAFNARSASFFSEYEACQQELSRGIAQVSGCKAWNGASGTFDLGKLDMTWTTSINERWKNRAEAIENKRAKEFAEGMKGRYHCRVQLATGAYVWMWVTDPSKVTQADVQFNEKYKEYPDILTKPEKGLVDEYFQTITEELKTGINQKTGKPLTDLEKAQRWSTIASAIAAVAIGAYYGGKGFTGKGTNAPKTPTLKGNKGGKNYTLDRGKNKGKTGYKKASGSEKVYNANGNPDLRVLRRPQFDEALKNGFPDGTKLNQHAYNSLFKSGRKDIMIDDIIDALNSKPILAKPGSVEYINPKTNTSIFVNPTTKEIVGIWPASFKK